VITELSDNIDRQRLSGWILYDANCSICMAWAKRIQPGVEPAGFRLEPLQSDWVRERLKLPEQELLREMRILTSGGEVFGGADAALYLASALDSRHRAWWAWMLIVVGKIPFGKWLARWTYRRIAARRNCRGGSCAVAPAGNGAK
jgi:predicted DCC family thiol-disulfide oxidoreductase YuxK